MASKILKSLLIWFLVSFLSILAGNIPGLIAVHSSGNASYVFNSHCIVYTDVTHEEFVDLTQWCINHHSPKK